MKSWFRYVAIVLTLVIVGCGTAHPVRAQWFGAQGSFQRTLNVSGTANLDVTTGSGRVEVHQGNNGRVEVRGEIRVGEFRRSRRDAEDIVRRLESNPPIEQSGSTIRIGRIEDRDMQRNVSISYSITVPPQTTVVASTGSGSILVSGVSGEVRADTGSGRIEVTDTGASVRANTGSGVIVANGVHGGLTASTGSGSVRASLTAAGNVDISTGSGSVEVSGVKGALRIHTGSGRITADGEPTGRWDLNASSGSIALRLPPQAAFDLYAHTSSGSISADHPITVQGRISRRNEVTGRVRGGGVAVDVRTSSGSIRVE